MATDILVWTWDEWDLFWISGASAMAPSGLAGNTTPLTSKQLHELEYEAYLKGVWRDKLQYPILKDEWQYNNFIYSFMRVVRLHWIEEVFDPSYKSKKQDRKLFIEKQKFAFTMLDETLKTDMGKSLVWGHAVDGDVQTIWKKLMEHARIST